LEKKKKKKNKTIKNELINEIQMKNPIGFESKEKRYGKGIGNEGHE